VTPVGDGHPLFTGSRAAGPSRLRHPRARRRPPIPFARALAGTLILAAAASCGRKGGDSGPTPAPPPATSEASADAHWGPGHARARLIADRASAAPGESLWVGVSFDIQPGWHLYWNGANDTGYPIHVRPELPSGWRAGKMLWPAPARHVSPGNILDHVYTDRVTLLLPLRAGPAESHSVTLRARLEWLACREICLPGSATVALTLPVRGTSGALSGTDGALPDSGSAARFAEARRRVPRPLSDSTVPVSTRFENGAAVIEVPGAERLAFFPGRDCARLANPIRDAATEGDRLHLVLAAGAGASPAVCGVLAVHRPGSDPEFYTLSLPPPTGS
jgi:DsbC/DsbD-like thiol-disulfide interchange protein